MSHYLGAAGDPRSYQNKKQDPTPEEREMTVGGRREGEVPWQPKGETVVSQAFSAIQKIHQTHREYLDAVDKDDRFTDEARQEAVSSFKNTETAKYLDTVEEVVDQRLTAAQAKLDAQFKGLSKDGDAAQESRNLRIRDRALDTLKASDSPVTAAQKMFEKATPEELSVYLQEVPAFLENRDLPTGFIPAVVEQKLPELAAAQREVNQAQQAKTVLDYDVTAIRNGIKTGFPPTQLVDPSRFDPDAV